MNNKVLDRLLERVPELRPAYEAELQRRDRPETHASLDDVLTSLVISLLESDEDEGILRRLFAFVEELASHDNRHVREMLKMTILRRLDTTQRLLAKARQYMGPGTRRLLNEVREYGQISKRLVDRVPELRPAYEAELEWQEAPGPHVIYGDVLPPFLISLLESDGDEELLRRIFAFLEELANDRDENVQEVVGVSVLESLMTGPLLTKARKYMGPATRRISDGMVAWHPEKT